MTAKLPLEATPKHLWLENRCRELSESIISHLEELMYPEALEVWAEELSGHVSDLVWTMNRGNNGPVASNNPNQTSGVGCCQASECS